MTDQSSADAERQWAAEKRDFVADRRDVLAGEREAAGDVRDRIADERELALDEREIRLDLRAVELGMAPDDAEVRSEAHDARQQARTDREERAAERDVAAGARDEATKRRLAADPQTQLAAAFASIAESLYSADSFDAVLDRIVHVAVSTLTGCEMASITLGQHGHYSTAATTDAAATAVDQAQYDADEGPCLDAVETTMVYAESFPDARWPTLAGRPADLGAKSAASYRLAPEGVQLSSTGGSLNTYGAEPDAFTDEAKEIGLILATHASMAAGAAHQRAALQDLTENLNKALMSRDVIGQAKGILMERLKLTPEDAFDVLRRSSNLLNKKLHTVAATLAETGELNLPVTERADETS